MAGGLQSKLGSKSDVLKEVLTHVEEQKRSEQPSWKGEQKMKEKKPCCVHAG